ncbi:putative endoIII-related endonuclease [Thermoplasmatales archaeon SCGC AB-539-N05]|nr:putative endoIII-related endonuclease [Thermoplasmatales archaeon SCGC AB-539-N05]
MKKTITKTIYQKMQEKYGYLYPWPMTQKFKKQDYFKRLITIVLSQNTSDENALRAYKQLEQIMEVTPENLAKADIQVIKNAIRTGGLYNIKASRLQNIAKLVLNQFNGDLNKLLDLPLGKARKTLIDISGVGKKTADVLLTTKHSHENIIPVDTHMNRIAKRLGLVSSSAMYDETQNGLIDFFPDEYRDRGSALLWLLAKHTCQARKPKCYECPLTELCNYYQNTLDKM